ncbi:MAG: endonuclease [Betaproteobacteria bacterium]|nr:endonuclease [Betaproteobacteria bacterium]
MSKLGRYASLVLEIFRSHYSAGGNSFEFKRAELEAVAKNKSITLPKNLGDIIYNLRYRQQLPQEITKTAPRGKEWIIEPAGIGKYRFALHTISRIVPGSNLIVTKIPDATPEIISANAKGDEQALLAIVRYNRLVDIFLGITAFSLQNHLRTTVKGMGQIEIDELYVGVDTYGAQYVVPVQAKGGTDQLGIIQTKQDIACCREKFPDLICRPLSAQFMDGKRIAMFELTVQDDQIRVLQERHYSLVPDDDVSSKDKIEYAKLARRTLSAHKKK